MVGTLLLFINLHGMYKKFVNFPIDDFDKSSMVSLLVLDTFTRETVDTLHQAISNFQETHMQMKDI